MQLANQTPSERLETQINERLGQRSRTDIGISQAPGDVRQRLGDIDRQNTRDLEQIIRNGEFISKRTADALREQGGAVETALIDAAQGIRAARLLHLVELRQAALDDSALSIYRRNAGLQEAQAIEGLIGAENERLRRRRESFSEENRRRRTDLEPEPVTPPERDFNDYEKFLEAQTAALAREENRRIQLTEGRIAATLDAERRGLEQLERQLQDGVAAAQGDADREQAVRTVIYKRRVELEASTTAQIDALRDAASRREERRQERQAIARERAAERQRDVALSVFSALQDLDADLGLSSQYEQDIIAAARWRDSLIQALRDVGLGHTDLVDLVNEGFRKMAERAKEQTTTLGVVRAALRDYARDAQNSFTRAREAAQNAFQGMTDALARFATTGKLEITDLANSIIADLARIAIQRNITGPLASAFFGALGGGGGAGGGGLFAPFLHAGGKSGSTTRRGREVPPDIFRFAPRAHRGAVAGLASDEIPYILRRGGSAWACRAAYRSISTIRGPRSGRCDGRCGWTPAPWWSTCLSRTSVRAGRCAAPSSACPPPEAEREQLARVRGDPRAGLPPGARRGRGSHPF